MCESYCESAYINQYERQMSNESIGDVELAVGPLLVLSIQIKPDGPGSRPRTSWKDLLDLV